MGTIKIPWEQLKSVNPTQSSGQIGHKITIQEKTFVVGESLTWPGLLGHHELLGRQVALAVDLERGLEPLSEETVLLVWPPEESEGVGRRVNHLVTHVSKQEHFQEHDLLYTSKVKYALIRKALRQIYRFMHCFSYELRNVAFSSLTCVWSDREGRKLSENGERGDRG